MTNLNNNHFRSLPCLIRRGIICLVIILIMVFLVMKVFAIFSPPNLIIESPIDGLVTQERQIEIKGQTVKESEIVINNQNIYIDDDGWFLTNIDLQKGLNLIKITAKKRYSKINEKIIRVLYTDDSINNN